MDISTGKMYQTKAEALLAGVAESDIAELIQDARGKIDPSFSSYEDALKGQFTEKALDDVLVRTK